MTADAPGYAHELHARFERLTSREWDVFVRVIEGKANKVIAYELGVAERTVKVYRKNMQKLGKRLLRCRTRSTSGAAAKRVTRIN